MNSISSTKVCLLETLGFLEEIKEAPFGPKPFALLPSGPTAVRASATTVTSAAVLGSSASDLARPPRASIPARLRGIGGTELGAPAPVLSSTQVRLLRAALKRHDGSSGATTARSLLGFRVG